MSFYLFNHLSKKQEITIVDNLMSFASVVFPLMALPQVYEIYSKQNVDGISLLSWLAFMVLGVIFLTYGIVHKLKPFIINQILWFIVDILIVVGVIIYR